MKQEENASIYLCNCNNYEDNIAFFMPDGKKKIDLTDHWRYFLDLRHIV